MSASALGRAARASLAGAALALACAEEPSSAGLSEPSASPARVERDWPAGTVLAVDDVAIDAAEVDAVAAVVGEHFPEYTRPHARRLALTNVVLPRAACRSQAEPVARERALAACRDARERLGERGDPAAAGLLVASLEGHFGRFDLDVWCAARELEAGRWSEPVELIGSWALLRVLDRDTSGPVVARTLDLELVRFPYVGSSDVRYLDAPEAVQRAVDASELTIVAPEWAETVPEAWRRRMDG